MPLGIARASLMRRIAAPPPTGLSKTYLGQFNSLTAGQTFSATVNVPSGPDAILVLVGGKNDGQENVDVAFVPAGCTYNGVQLTAIQQVGTSGGTAPKATAGALGLRNPASGANTLALQVGDTNNAGMLSWTVHVYALTNVKAAGDFWGDASGFVSGSQQTVSTQPLTTTAPGSLILGIATADSLAGANGTPAGDITSTDSIDNDGTAGNQTYWVVGEIGNLADATQYEFRVVWDTAARRGVAAVEILA